MLEVQDFFSNLPFHYETLRAYNSIRPKGFRYFTESFTIEATFKGKQIQACGEGFLKKDAASKALAELIERTVLLDLAANQSQNNAGQKFANYNIDYDKLVNQKLTLPLENSNGWAAHIEKTDSENAAIRELVERDAVLAHWYTCTPFSELNLNTIPLIKQWADKELINSEFPQLRILISSIGFAPTVTVLLANSDNYGVAGHSAKSNLFEAIESALGEATRAAHLTLRKAYFRESKNIFCGNNPSEKNIDSGVHAVFYAYHTPFPNWMFGAKINLEEAKHLYQQAWTKFYFYQNSKFHVQTVMNNPLFVSFAARADIIPLRWGITDTQRIEEIKTLERFKNYKIINTDIHIVC